MDTLGLCAMRDFEIYDEMLALYTYIYGELYVCCVCVCGVNVDSLHPNVIGIVFIVEAVSCYSIHIYHWCCFIVYYIEF